jgi:DNA recombination protein RmuC
LDIILAALSALTLILVVLLLVRAGKPAAETERLARMEAELVSLRQETATSMARSSVSLAELITKSGGEMRLDVADRISAGLSDIVQRVEAQLKSGRDEAATGMSATTETVVKRLAEFGEMTEGRISALDKRTVESLDAIKEKVNERLMSIGQQVQAKLDENIKEGFSHFEKVQEHLRKAEAHLAGVSAVGSSINELNSLLKLPHLRGGFGEVTLELLVADMLPASLYETQVSVGGGERVDVLVKLPGASLPIDSKFPREQVLHLFEATDAVKLAEARKALSRVVRELAKDIRAKYIRPDHGTTDMALMFLPSETLYFEIVRDEELWGFMQKQKVYPVSPNTLAVTLKGISLSYDYYRMAKGVEATIEDIKKAQKHFGHFNEKFENAGKQLDRARDAFSVANTHLGRYTSSVIRLTGEAPGPVAELPGDESV